jgi:hypothetical protein
MPRYVRAIRTLTRFGEIPSDVVAARPDLDPDVTARLRTAFLGVARHPRGRELLHEIFGADELRRPDLASYEVLRKVTRDAVAEGLLDAEEEIDDSEIEELDDESNARTVRIRAARPVEPKTDPAVAAPERRDRRIR